eukprot:CAMPEP_0173282060 /NCGR_PEP_ID=MMETSP1143-20121109/6593_1 /TAXON_ID=483371 /ORGANISM="non described non described, Strain CCMP2298" /LENGTH=58 /DNA_ID=CAMNT_0014219555 /DNA_START=515 /DNA_END=692 /DNA_ORIENTATION=-
MRSGPGSANILLMAPPMPPPPPPPPPQAQRPGIDLAFLLLLQPLASAGLIWDLGGKSE